MFLGEDLLPLLVLALGAAMAVGSGLALARPQGRAAEGDLERAPVGRSLVMVAVGVLASVWAIASLATG